MAVCVATAIWIVLGALVLYGGWRAVRAIQARWREHQEYWKGMRNIRQQIAGIGEEVVEGKRLMEAGRSRPADQKIRGAREHLLNTEVALDALKQPAKQTLRERFYNRALHEWIDGLRYWLEATRTGNPTHAERAVRKMRRVREDFERAGFQFR
jgi:hypothetical protein